MGIAKPHMIVKIRNEQKDDVMARSELQVTDTVQHAIEGYKV